MQRLCQTCCQTGMKALRRIEVIVVLQQLGSSLFSTALQMVVKDRTDVNASSTNTTLSSRDDSQQKVMTDFFMTYNLINHLVPILPALLLARLGDRGWRRVPVVVPLCGYLLFRLALLLVVIFRLPLELIFAAEVVYGLSGGFCSYWSGVMTLVSLSSTATDRSKVLSCHIPFLVSSVEDFKDHIPRETDMKVAMNVYELSSAAGLPCEIDPALVVALSSQKSENISPEEEYKIACLLMVFVAVSLPTLASNVMSQYSPAIEGHCNNIHCLAKAINQIAAALFTIHKGSIEDRLKEFLALASSSLLKIGQETDKMTTRNRESVYLLLDMIVQESPFLTMDLLESCFPYVLLRNAYHAVYKQSISANA